MLSGSLVITGHPADLMVRSLDPDDCRFPRPPSVESAVHGKRRPLHIEDHHLDAPRTKVLDEEQTAR